MADNNGPRAEPVLIPGGTFGKMFKEDHSTMLHTKYESSRPSGIKDEDCFKFFFIVSLLELYVAVETNSDTICFKI